MPCAICHVRKPRRFCPAVNGDICTICCGEQREVTLNCPLECSYLQEAHKHEQTGLIPASEFPNQDIKVDEEFLEEHEALFSALAQGLHDGALETPGAVDTDVRDALAALIRTQRTLQSGVYYESRPENALAHSIFDAVREELEDLRASERENLGMRHTRDSDVLTMLVFMQRLELDRNNGRPRGRAFIDFLHRFFGDIEEASDAPRASSLIIP